MGILAGRVVLITGASSGIGEAAAKLFAAEGAKLVLAARRLDRIQALAAEIEAAGGEALAVRADVTSEADVEAMFAALKARFGKIDVLINNAGISGDIGIEDLTLDDWRRIIDTNLTSAFLCARAAFAPMREQGRGRIINVGSISARTPRPNSPAYAASKYGIEGLTRSLALDGREHGIVASIVHPGTTKTELSEVVQKMTPGRRVMLADDVAQMIVLMAGLPDGTNVFEALMLPLDMPFMGRG